MDGTKTTIHILNFSVRLFQENFVTFMTDGIPGTACSGNVLQHTITAVFSFINKCSAVVKINTFMTDGIPGTACSGSTQPCLLWVFSSAY